MAGGKAAQFQLASCCTETPQRISSLLAVTTECCVKSRPFTLPGAWHSTQYFEKKPWPQLAHVSGPESDPDADPELDPEIDPDPDPVLDPEEQAAASSPTASKA